MPEKIQHKLIEEEMKESYVDYAMSVIVSRALPDVRDGLKPVHRRVLYTMHNLGLQSNKPFRKSASIVGTCMARYHPHGDAAIYDTLVRMAQDFSLRYPLIKGQGNFGSVDGDPPSAQRYSEAKLSRIAEEMLTDIEKDTVAFKDNYDASTKEPIILPAKLPNLLINGSSGIAVGMATNIPPHNLSEVAKAIVAAIDNPEITVNDLLNVMPGPDFPTGGIICGRNGIKSYYMTGKGKLVLRAKTSVEKIKDKQFIIVSEIPYQINKSLLLEDLADSVKEGVIEGISDLRDESDKEGMRIVIELKRDADSNIVLNQLYKHSQLQTTFGVIMLALLDGQPKIMGIKDIISHYINHRKDVVVKRSNFELRKAEEKVHILEGLKIALLNIDSVVAVVKKSEDPNKARERLMKNFKLTEIQAQSVLDMKLQRLTSLEQNKIDEEHKDLIKNIRELKDLLASEKRILEVIKNELLEFKKFYDLRRTEILDMEEEIDIEDLIKEENVVVVMSNLGYVKKMPMAIYKSQRRGGKGVIGAVTKEEDFVKYIFTTSNHNYILCFTNKGKVSWLKAYMIPTASRYSKGKPIVNLLRLEKDEQITALMPVPRFESQHYLLMATKKGLIKKTALAAYSKPRKGGIRAIKLRKDDELVSVKLTPGTLGMILATKDGYAVKFNETDVRSMGRSATGVRGVRLTKNDEIVGMEVAYDTITLLTITENGYGKRSTISDYRLIRRGGKGVINIKTDERNGKVIGVKTVKDSDEILLTTAKGHTIRIPVSNVSVIGRNTKGVRIMQLNPGDKVTTLARVLNNSSSAKTKT